jgi:hypothetical protein
MHCVPLPVSRFLTRLSVLIVTLFAAVGSVRATVSLSATTFAADNLPTIHADAGDLSTAQAYAGSGGYYKLRAKFIVPYDPGYYQAIDSINNQGHRLAGSPGAGTYTVQLYWVAYNSAGALQTSGPFHSIAVTVTAPATGNSGLQADYFNGSNFQTLARTAPSGETPNYSWGSDGPEGTGTDTFSVRWHGQIEPLHTGTHTFTTGSDDGMRVFVANLSQPVAGAYWDHGYYEASGDIHLTANTRYAIRVEFFENYGGAEAKLFWQAPGQAREIVPVTRLLPPGQTGTSSPPVIVTAPQSQTVNVGATVVFTVVADGSPAPAFQWRKGGAAIAGATGSSFTLTNVQSGDAGSYDVVATNAAGTATSNAATLTVNPVAGQGTGTGLRGDYYNGTNFNSFILTRTDADVNFPWGNGSPAAGIGADNFTVRWTGLVEAPVTGHYTFSTNNDDGVRLRVNGVVIIDDWTPHGPTDRFSAPVHLTAGTRVPISLEFYEAGGGAVVALSWQPPGQSRVIIPRARLYPPDPGSMPATWQTLLTASGELYFDEETDEEGNGTGNYSHPVNQHTIHVPANGTLRLYTTGEANTTGHLYNASGQLVLTNLDGGGDGGNFLAETPISAGRYELYVGAHFEWNSPVYYQLYADFRPNASPPTITSALSASTPVGAAYSYQITASSTETVTYNATGLPAGLSVAPSGLISGTPSQAGTFQVQLFASNSVGTDQEILTLTTFVVAPTASVAASATTLTPGQTVTISAFATSNAGTLQYLNIDQVSPNAGYYGVGETGSELPPNNAHYASPEPSSHTRHLALTLVTPGTYRFRAAVSDGYGWYPGSNDVTVTVTAGTYSLTVEQGSGSGSYAAGAVVPIAANAAASGTAFSHWTVVAGNGTFASSDSASTTFTLGSGAATIRANYTALQPPAITTPPGSQTVALGQTATFSVTASGSPPLTYQWRKASVPLANGGNISGANSATLTLANVNQTNAGSYDVIVSNAAGATTSATAQLTVTSSGDDGTPQLRLHRSP